MKRSGLNIKSIYEVYRKNDRVFENTYSMLVVPAWSITCNDRKGSTSLDEMTFYMAMNINTWNVY